MSNKMDRPLVTVDGRTLMDRPLEPPNFVVDTLISQGLHILAGSPRTASSRSQRTRRTASISVRSALPSARGWRSRWRASS